MSSGGEGPVSSGGTARLRNLDVIRRTPEFNVAAPTIRRMQRRTDPARRPWACASIVVAATLAAGGAHAQAPAAVAADANEQGKTAAGANGNAKPPADAKGQAKAEKFDIWEYRVLGADVLDARTVERAVYPYLGPGRSIADVQSARQALENAYRAAGYSTAFVDIPEQTVDQGVVRLKATEGRLDRVRVTGARYFSNRQILARLPAVESGEVPHLPDVQKQLAALNRETPDRAVMPILKAGRYPGTVDMELRVQDHYPLHGGLEVNNRYTADTSELRTNLTLSYDNLWQRQHTASVQYQTAPQAPDEAKVVALTYLAPLRRANTLLAFYGVDSKSDVATVGTLSVIGQGRIYGARGIRSLASRDSFFQSATLGLDYKDFGEDINLTEETGLSTAIRYFDWSASYSFGWIHPKSRSSFGIGADWGLRGFGNSDAEFENKRFKGRGNYVYLTGSAEHLRQVLGKAQLDARLSWQYSTLPLVSNEQFTAGGATSVRGYLEAERLGDSGASFSVELRSPSLLKAGGKVQDFRVLGFFDAASLSIVDPLPDQEARFRLQSAGAGFRFSGLAGLEAELDWARPLLDGANVSKHEDRIHFLLKYEF